ncbi:MAG: galactokinase [Acidobacteria bacterium]|nr:galactokinase [Acidobacteriota bacterium]
MERELHRTFRRLYASKPRFFRAPGRVNLIGEHTDYNDGFVLPMAIDRGITVAAAPRQDRRVRVFSASMNESREFDLDYPGPRQRGLWLDYVEGVAHALMSRGVRLRGADLALTSDLSIGGGLSSSAALEISVGKALLAVSDQDLDLVSLALAGQQAEHQYVGAKCGIMDQFTAAMGRAGHALLIDCRKLEGTPIPLNLPDSSVVICDTKVRHSLAASEYNARRSECDRAVAALREVLPGVKALRDVTPAELDRWEACLPEPVRSRARHVVTENERTLDAARALAAGDMVRTGRLMDASHRSLREDYQVSCPELDLMVAAATAVPGVFGARMTGGGFGGCTVSLVRSDAVENFRTSVSRDYERATGIKPAIFTVIASDGVQELAFYHGQGETD